MCLLGLLLVWLVAQSKSDTALIMFLDESTCKSCMLHMLAEIATFTCCVLIAGGKPKGKTAQYLLLMSFCRCI